MNANNNYLYDDEDMNSIILNYGKHHGFAITEHGNFFSVEEGGVILDNNQNAILTVVKAQETGVSTAGSDVKIEYIAQALQYIIDITKTKPDTEQLGIMLFPVNIGGAHWCLCQLRIKLISQTGKNYILITENFNIFIYDSLNNQQSMLILGNKIADNTIKFTPDNLMTVSQRVHINLKYQKQQPDTTSCGPITIDSLWNIITEGCIDQDKLSYSAEEIIQIRTAHLALHSDNNFVHKQQQYNTSVVLSPKPIVNLYSSATTNGKTFTDELTEIITDEFKITALNFLIGELNSDLLVVSRTHEMQNNIEFIQQKKDLLLGLAISEELPINTNAGAPIQALKIILLQPVYISLFNKHKHFTEIFEVIPVDNSNDYRWHSGANKGITYLVALLTDYFIPQEKHQIEAAENQEEFIEALSDLLDASDGEEEYVLLSKRKAGSRPSSPRKKPTI